MLGSHPRMINSRNGILHLIRRCNQFVGLSVRGHDDTGHGGYDLCELKADGIVFNHPLLPATTLIV